MHRKTLVCLATVTLVICLTSGCSLFQNKDEKFARSVIDAVYAGSLTTIKDSLTPEMQAAPTQMIAAQGAALSQKFGPVKSLTLKSTAPVPGLPDMTVKVWTVTAERGSFDMQLVMNKDGKLAGLWFS